MIKKTIALLTSMYVYCWTILAPHSSAFAVAVATQVKCEPVPNMYWTPHMSKSYAKALMDKYHWDRSEFKALVKLWYKESKWISTAYNPEPGNKQGDHAFGIPQLLGMNKNTPAPLQIERGLEYIKHRYEKPSVAWAHHRKHNWY